MCICEITVSHGIALVGPSEFYAPLPCTAETFLARKPDIGSRFADCGFWRVAFGLLLWGGSWPFQPDLVEKGQLNQIWLKGTASVQRFC